MSTELGQYFLGMSSSLISDLAGVKQVKRTINSTVYLEITRVDEYIGLVLIHD